MPNVRQDHRESAHKSLCIAEVGCGDKLTTSRSGATITTVDALWWASTTAVCIWSSKVRLGFGRLGEQMETHLALDLLARKAQLLEDLGPLHHAQRAFVRVLGYVLVVLKRRVCSDRFYSEAKPPRTISISSTSALILKW